MNKKEYSIQKALGLLKLFHFINWQYPKTHWELNILIISPTQNNANKILEEFLQSRSPQLHPQDFIWIDTYPDSSFFNNSVNWQKENINYHECYFHWKPIKNWD